MIVEISVSELTCILQYFFIVMSGYKFVQLIGRYLFGIGSSFDNVVCKGSNVVLCHVQIHCRERMQIKASR
jgi:hypothetical protein